MKTTARVRLALMALLYAAICLPPYHSAADSMTGIYRVTFDAKGWYLTVELLKDDLAHFELSAAPLPDETLPVSPMVANTNYPGPSWVSRPAPTVIETRALRLAVAPDSLCVTLTDLVREPDLLLTTICPTSDPGEWVSLSFTQENTTDLYGLGEQFQRHGGVSWLGQRRMVRNLYGNELNRFNGGNVGNAQFPILYALGAGTDNYALFLDHVYQQYWDFTRNPFVVTTSHAPLRWYIITGPDLPALRRAYIDLTGHPPVPPKQMFGLWVSEFGYESWDELTGVLESLEAENFPVDGFVLDLQWFGGVIPKANSQMGSLVWDETHFPDPAHFIAQLREKYGIGIMVIEEPYVSKAALGYEEAQAQGVFVRSCGLPTCAPVTLNGWWGTGSMIDWTNPEGAAWWHDHRRQHLIDEGVMAHWTDLGEPETYNDAAWYYGFPELDRHKQADIHNIYNLLWSKSMWDGYRRNRVEQRLFILSRSGTSGSQRYGVGMWSGDIGANLPSLAAHLDVQMHMSLSGIDYFGADVGGFMRQALLPGVTMDELYSIWLANAVLLDVPLRPHTYNLQNLYETSPSLIGDVHSNLTNVRLRYALSPYLYTLAHRAYRDGEPVFAPLVYYFQNDPNVRAIGDQKMIGPDLMMAAITGLETTVPVYLPAGGWFDYYSHDYFESSGEWIEASTTSGGVRRAPLFVRAGAVIPQMVVDDRTLNMLGQRRDGSTQHDLILSVYAVPQGENFTLVEDDGRTTAYQTGAVRETPIRYGACETGWFVEIGPAAGSYQGAPGQRRVEVHVILPGSEWIAAGTVDVNRSQRFVLPVQAD